MPTRAVLRQCLVDGSMENLRQHPSWLKPLSFMPRSNQPSPMPRSRRHSSYRLKRYCEGMVPRSLEARSTPASPDILRTPPVHQSLKPSFEIRAGAASQSAASVAPRPKTSCPNLSCSATCRPCGLSHVHPPVPAVARDSRHKDARVSQRLCDSQCTSLLRSPNGLSVVARGGNRIRQPSSS